MRSWPEGSVDGLFSSIFLLFYDRSGMVNGALRERQCYWYFNGSEPAIEVIRPNACMTIERGYRCRDYGVSTSSSGCFVGVMVGGHGLIRV